MFPTHEIKTRQQVQWEKLKGVMDELLELPIGIRQYI